MKKVLLLDTSVASLNIGDEIINDSIRINWPELYKHNYINRYPSHTPPHSWWQQLINGKHIRLYREMDYKILCGTNALFTNMFRPYMSWNVHMLNAGILKNTILLGVGAGINSKHINFYTKRLFNKILSRDIIHSTRDEYTKNLLLELGFKAVNTGCPTIWGLTPEHCEAIPKVKSSDVVFTLTSSRSDITKDKLMIDIILRNYQNVFFWPQQYSDIEYLESLKVKGIISITPNLQAYDELLGSSIDYVGNRLHGGIRSLQHKNRSIIISIDYRAKNMAKDYTLPIISRNDIESRLETMINSNFSTEIKGIDFDKIKEWKSQFQF